MKKIITTTIALLSSMATLAQDQKVAVFNPAGDVANYIIGVVREEISSIIVNTSGYTVLERSLIDRVLEENRFQAGGLVDDAQISEMGRRMGANLVLITNFTKMGNGNFHISAKLIDVMTARIEKQQTTQTAQGENDLISAVNRMGREMFVATPGVFELSPVFLEECFCEVLIRDTKRGLLASIVKVEAVKMNGGRKLKTKNNHLFIEALSTRFCPEGWRAPSIAEWRCIYRNREKVGGFSTSELYYTSTLKGSNQVPQLFNVRNGKTSSIGYGRTYNLRCIRDR